MSKAGELDSTTKNVIQEIMRECTNKGMPITEIFVKYYVQLLMLDPTWGITTDVLPQRAIVQSFVKFCVQKFDSQYTPDMITLKMQLYFQNNFDSAENVIEKHRCDLKARLAPLEKEVLETQSLNKNDIAKLFQKLVYLVTLYSGLGNPTIKSVYMEAETALKSVLLEDEMEDFMFKSSYNKEMQIVELSELVTGIRLYNRESKKVGTGIEDLPKLLNQAIETTKYDIQDTLSYIMDSINMFTTAIDNCFQLYEDEFEGCSLIIVLPDGVLEEDLEHVKGLLIAFRQYELFVRKILVKVGKLEEITSEKCNLLKEQFVIIDETVQFKFAVPTIQVFPLFCDVAQTWCDIQNQTVSLAHLNQMLIHLQTSIKDLINNRTVLKLMVGPDGPVSDTERLAETIGLTISAMEEHTVILDPVDVNKFDQLSFQYLGFCAWKFVETNGGLIPGNPNMGIANIQDMLYIFSSPEAALIYGKNPSRYILRGLNLARNKPELINLLGLKDHLAAVREVEELVVKIPKVIVTYEAAVQTDLHPIKSIIDPNYMWNVWDWKRLALKLADISKRKTCSTQTKSSNAWQAIKTQTQYKKDFNYQTKKDNYTNVPTLSNYIYGLRGRKDNIQHIITLTRPVTE